VAEWAKTLGWPLIGDVLSQTGQPLPCADLWLGNGKAVSELAQAQIVVQLGSSLTGKRVLQWQATCEPDEYWLVDNLPGRLDPAHHRGRRLLSVERWLDLHPAENASRGRRDPQLAGQAWQARPAMSLWRSAAGAPFAAICRIRGSCLSATAWWCA
jgi:2-succinyl-5-enolpyruvyl-6-hydroxy-3-cyclohexene-1-carboxylate synthase